MEDYRCFLEIKVKFSDGIFPTVLTTGTLIMYFSIAVNRLP